MFLLVVLGITSTLMAANNVISQSQDWSVCPPCKCKWTSGRKTAECTRLDLRMIPDWLSSEIQFVDLSENRIANLPKEAFRSVGLIHLQKIFLKACGIEDVHRDAFKGLQILIELDLSENKIHAFHPETFVGNFRLRMLVASKNRMLRLEDGLFRNLTFLHSVEMSDCQLSYVGVETFYNASNLQTLALDGNNLTHMKVSVIDKLTRLRSLVLHNNPWKCDCLLKPFRDWVIEHNLYSNPTACKEPQHLENKYWIDLSSESFACKPIIKWPLATSSVTADNDDVTLSCQVTGIPSPEVQWVYNSRIISNNSRTKYGDFRYAIRTSGDVNKWVNLTVSRVRPQDQGRFTCVANSSGGVDERHFNLIVDSSAGGYINSPSVMDSWPLIIGLPLGFIALLIIITVLCCCFCRRREIIPGKKSPVNGLSPNGDLPHHVTSSTEQEKSLLTVNPVQKPPRRYEAHPTSNSATELSELNRKLLDEGSITAPSQAGDEDHSIGSVEVTPSRSRRPDNETYPPDLIAFPGRSQYSPSPRLTIQSSPLHSPVYNGFGTLPMSRSQSPFSPSTVSLPRQGYVTIPRRPRVPSWSSVPSSSMIEEPTKPEPFYDNLGPRTTADGSSVLSLNKAGVTGTVERPPVPKRVASPESGQSYWPPPAPLKRPSSTDTPLRPKVAPKPPPKPKPKGNGPLYEDEGEDGTEV